MRTQAYDYLIGVDGGGTKTLARVVTSDGVLLAEATGPGSALRIGARAAWDAIGVAITGAFNTAGVAIPSFDRLATGIGIAGYNVTQWAEDFRRQAPAFGFLRIDTDATTTLLGAHQGQAGAVIAVGTGTIGMATYADGSGRIVDGWGFPSGDDASGAWMGLRAIHHVQHVIDGRAPDGALAAATLAYCTSDDATGAHGHSARDIVLDWLARADQAAYAQLARLVVRCAPDDLTARSIMEEAAAEIERMAAALDPSGKLPLSLCGGLADALPDYLCTALRQRITPARADAADGALLMLRHALVASTF